MSKNSEYAKPTQPCNGYLAPVAIDLAVCVIGFLGLTSGNQSFLVLALITLYAYGFWVYFKSGVARGIHKFFKGGDLLGSLFMLTFLGLVAPVVHLAYAIALCVACPNSIPTRLYARLAAVVPTTDETSFYCRSLFVGVWSWLVVLVIFSSFYNLLLRAPGLLEAIASAVEAAEPDDILGYFIFALIAIPIYLVLIVIGLIVHFAWNFISVSLALIITGFGSVSLLPLLADYRWPKARWLIVGSAITSAVSLVVYLVPVHSLLFSDMFSYNSWLDMFTSLPFLVTSFVVAIMSIPLLYRWTRLSAKDLFPDTVTCR